MTTKTIENITIATVWTVVFASPLLFGYYQQAANDTPINWHELSVSYTFIAAYFILFALHNYAVIPLLYARKRYWAYALTVAAMLGLFAFATQDSPRSHNRFMPRFEQRNMPDGQHPDRHNRNQDRNQDEPHDKRHFGDRFHHQDSEFRQQHFALLSPPETARLIIAFLMLGVNLGLYAMAMAHQQHGRLKELEQQNLRQQLEYLKYQINPHFFMNTLNNIHVLIDVDSEKAKRSLVELSKLMRYMLYDGNGSKVALWQEIEFIKQYIWLMKLRYSNKVEIVCNMPEVTANIQIAPLLLGTFIENAFKHGISYQNRSFIHISLNVKDDSTICFSCSNSRHKPEIKDNCGGIGLENVRKRLDLIYQDNYSLEVNDANADIYTVSLELKGL